MTISSHPYGTINFEYLNVLPAEELREELFRCSGSMIWSEKVIERRPFKDEGHLRHVAVGAWYNLPPEEWKNAFLHHPKIGDIEALRTKFATTSEWSSKEQSGVQNAPERLLEALRKGNEEYEQKFGYIFIICAAGKSAEEMLSSLQNRLKNKAEPELFFSTNEHLRITLLRMEKIGSQ